MSLLSRYNDDPDYRKFLIELPNLNLSEEFNEKGQMVDNVIKKILDSVGNGSYDASQEENKIILEFVAYKSELSVDDLESIIKNLGSSVGNSSYDLSKINLIEL